MEPNTQLQRAGECCILYKISASTVRRTFKINYYHVSYVRVQSQTASGVAYLMHREHYFYEAVFRGCCYMCMGSFLFKAITVNLEFIQLGGKKFRTLHEHATNVLSFSHTKSPNM